MAFNYISKLRVYENKSRVVINSRLDSPRLGYPQVFNGMELGTVSEFFDEFAVFRQSALNAIYLMYSVKPK